MATVPKSRAVDAIGEVVSSGALMTDPGECAVFADDVFSKGPAPLAVFQPVDKEELARGVAAATAEGVAVVPRGGGMSYTGGYIAPAAGMLIVDTGRMQRILGIDETDMTVTVEAGCTWARLHDALQPKRLRAASWGTLSGIKAAIGGGMSQNGIFWGARNGTLAEGAISFEVVLADGRIVSTGSEFFRPYGPDLTALFAADTGAFGVKATVTLQLVREGTGFAYRSYAFESAENFFAAASEIARAGLASESFGFDPFLQAQRMKRESLAKDAKSLLNMAKAQGSAWKGIKEGAKVALAGRSFLDNVPFSLHAIAEARSEAAAEADARAMDKIAVGFGGHTIENTIPKILRANPFPPVNSMIGPAAERWVPVHGFLPHSKLLPAWREIQALYESHAEEMQAEKVEAGAMLANVSPSACLIEPVFFWPDELHELHRRSVEKTHLAKLTEFPANERARALVARLRAKVIDIMRDLGAAHLQIARTYPLKDSHDPAAWEIIKALKRHVDPKGLMNPGSLGLE